MAKRRPHSPPSVGTSATALALGSVAPETFPPLWGAGRVALTRAYCWAARVKKSFDERAGGELPPTPVVGPRDWVDLTTDAEIIAAAGQVAGRRAALTRDRQDVGSPCAVGLPPSARAARPRKSASGWLRPSWLRHPATSSIRLLGERVVFGLLGRAPHVHPVRPARAVERRPTGRRRHQGRGLLDPSRAIPAASHPHALVDALPFHLHDDRSRFRRASPGARALERCVTCSRAASGGER
jgi:hypothetical protein